MKRMLVIVVAVALAAVGAVGVLAYARSADQRAVAGQETVEVYVSTREVPAGTTAAEAIEGGLLQTSLVAAKGVPDGALTEVTDETAEQVAMSTIAPGEIVLARRFGSQTAVQDALVVPEGLVAVTVELSDPARVGPFLRPGSTIAVYDTFTTRNPADNDMSPNGALQLSRADEGKVNATRVLIPRVDVLAVGEQTRTTQSSEGDGTQQTEQTPKALVTLAVTPEDAPRLVHGTQTGLLYFGLLGTGTEVPQSVIEDRQLFAETD